MNTQINPYAQQSLGGVQAVRENTALEQHLNELHKLHDHLGGAATRLMRIADRLLGSEPSPLNGTKGGAPTPGDPPLLSRMEHAAMDNQAMIDVILQHTQRLERL